MAVTGASARIRRKGHLAASEKGMTDDGTGSSGQQGFAPPTGAAAAQSEEDASVQFEAPSEGLTEQAAFSITPEAMSGIPAQLLEARDAIEQAIRQQRRPSTAQSLEAFTSGAGNIQGVAIGLGEPGGPGEPGAPTLNAFVADDAHPDQVRSVVVESMGVQAAGDLPITVRKSGGFDARPHRFKIRLCGRSRNSPV